MIRPADPPLPTFEFRFVDRWAALPDTPAGRNRGQTHGVEVLPDGRIVVFRQDVPGVLFFGRDGSLLDGRGERFVGAHGMSLTTHDGAPAFWLVDELSCEVVKTTLEGETILRLEPPPIDARPDGRYTPTWADQDPHTGDIWVGDGYGGSAVHRYDGDGHYYTPITELTGQRLRSPHGLRFGPDGHLWLTDRENHRVLVLDAAGEVVRESSRACHSPCSFAFHDGHAYVAELFGGLKVLDMELNVVADLFQNPWMAPDPGWEDREQWVWPMEQTEQGYPNVAGTDRYDATCFNSPHGIAVDPESGDVYVAEWMRGGRVVKLEKHVSA